MKAERTEGKGWGERRGDVPFRAYPIDITIQCDKDREECHYRQIDVYGSEALADHIISLLNEFPVPDPTLFVGVDVR